MENTLTRNQVFIEGKIISDFTFSHEVYGESFYKVDVIVSRLSQAHDVIPLIVSERLFDVKHPCMGVDVCVKGEFRSYNQHTEDKNHLILSVFVREIELIQDVDEISDQPNEIYLDGFICKEPIYRKTPLGREIADIMIAVNRAYGKTDYIPCICWGRTARFAGRLDVGEHVEIWGRIQSREYRKKVGADNIVKRVAYEVSVSKLDCVDEC